MSYRGYDLTPEEKAQIAWAWEVELFLKGHPFAEIRSLSIVDRRHIITYQNGIAQGQKEEIEANKWRK